MTIGLAIGIYFAVGVVCVVIASRLPSLFGPTTELFVFVGLAHSLPVFFLPVAVWVFWPVTLMVGMLMQWMSLKPDRLRRPGDGTAVRRLPWPRESAVCVTELRPFGKVEWEGNTYPATCLGTFIEVGTTVVVLEQRGAELVVELPEYAEERYRE